MGRGHEDQARIERKKQALLKEAKAYALWYDKTKELLREAWNHGLDGRKAALYARITQEEYKQLLMDNQELRDIRDMEVDRPLLEAEMAVVEAIRKGKLSAAQYYLDRRDPAFSKKDIKEKKVEVPVKEKEEETLAFLKDLKPEIKFDFEMERLRPIISPEDEKSSEMDDRIRS